MEDPPLPYILIILGLVLIGGFLSLSETAIISSRKSYLRAKTDGDDKKQRKTLNLIEKRSKFLTAIQISINTIGALAGVLGGFFLAEPLGGILERSGMAVPFPEILSILIVTAGIGFVYIIFGEIVPKQAALSNPEKFCIRLASVLSFLTWLLSPLVTLFSLISRGILAFFGIRGIREYAITENELKNALIEGERSGLVESEERTMVEGVFYLGDRPVGNFMTHRSDIAWLDIGSSMEDIKAAAMEAREQCYLPVASGSLDNVLGVVAVQDIFISFIQNSRTELKDIMKPALIVPETLSALKAFEAFKKGEADYLFVMDEYGGFAGALSSRDLIEEIVGELSAPSEEDEEIIKQDDGTYLMDGMTHIDDIAELLSIKDLLWEPQEYHTLAGFILEIAGEIPRTGEVFEWHHFKFKILDMDGNRIDKVLVCPPGGNSPPENIEGR